MCFFLFATKGEEAFMFRLSYQTYLRKIPVLHLPLRCGIGLWIALHIAWALRPIRNLIALNMTPGTRFLVSSQNIDFPISSIRHFTNLFFLHFFRDLSQNLSFLMYRNMYSKSPSRNSQKPMSMSYHGLHFYSITFDSDTGLRVLTR